MPFDFVVKNASNNFPEFSKSMPIPQSWTSNRTWSSSWRWVLTTSERERSCYFIHCVCRVKDQVQDDLLKLGAIARDRRQVIGEVLSQHDAIYLKFVHRQCDNLACSLIQIQRFDCRALICKQRP